jgi:predicted small metal-binding protein
MKEILCGDLVPGCTFRARGETDAEVLFTESRHAREAHGLDVTPQFMDRAKLRIRDTEASSDQPLRPRAARSG